jgi:hypothetical protein
MQESVRHRLSKIDQLLDNEGPRDVFERFPSHWISEPAKKFALKILGKTFHLMRDQLR